MSTELVDKGNGTFINNGLGETLETVIGDEQQAVFMPRMKVKKWNNECNLSLGVPVSNPNDWTYQKVNNRLEATGPGIKARFYGLTKQEPPHANELVQITGSSTMTPEKAAAEYELFRQKGHDVFNCIWYVADRPSLMLFADNPASRYINLDGNRNAIWQRQGFGETDSFQRNVPTVRVPGHVSANPYYMDPGLINIDIHFGFLDVPDINEKWLQAIIDVLSGYGVETTRGDHMKLFFADNGNLVKYHSAQNTHGILAGYLNLETRYNRHTCFYDLLKWPDLSADVRDPYAYGLRAKYPNIPSNVVDQIFARFAGHLGLPLQQRSYTQAEQDQITAIEVLHQQPGWLEEGKRADAGWWYSPKEDGFEFEVIFDSLPASNRVDLSMQTKGVKFLYQAPLTEADKLKGFHRPPHVEGSYAVYATDQRLNDTYRNGKVCHIYRPIAHDATGKQVWCDLELNQQAGLLTVVVPQPFLNTAVYPVTVDPTVGYANAGASLVAASILVDLFGIRRFGYDGHVDIINAFLKHDGPGLQFEFALYSFSGTTATFIQDTPLLTNNVLTSQWYRGATSPRIPVSSSTEYWVCAKLVSSIYQASSIHYDTGVSGDGANMFNSGGIVGGSWPSPVVPTVDDRLYSIYGTTEAGSTLTTLGVG